MIAPVEDLRSGGGAAERTGDRPAAGLDAGAVRTLCSECDKKERHNQIYEKEIVTRSVGVY